MNPFSNYTGAYLSDGRFQPSVAYGRQRPKSELDKFSRLHDTMYAIYPGRRSRRAADRWYYENVPNDLLSRIAGNLVWYGNRAMNFWDHPYEEYTGYVGDDDMQNMYNAGLMDPNYGNSVYTPGNSSFDTVNQGYFTPSGSGARAGDDSPSVNAPSGSGARAGEDTFEAPSPIEPVRGFGDVFSPDGINLVNRYTSPVRMLDVKTPLNLR